MDAKDRKIERLERLVAKQAAMIEKLTQRVDQLEHKLPAARKDSSNSSKPPSSDIVKKPIRIDEHRGLAYWCSTCQKIHYAPFPPEVEKGRLLGPRLTTLVADMKGVCHEWHCRR